MLKPKIGLALGSGAARGLAHIGVLKALEEFKIPVDMVAGTSAGALIGALYCSGVDLRVIEQVAREIPRKDLIDISVPRVGFIKGNRIEELIKLLTRNRTIEDMDIPFKAVAADLVKGEKVVLGNGPIHKAVRASISIPGIFVPVYSEERVLVDGAILERVPVGIVKEMGADVVIGVDVGFSTVKGGIGNIFDVLFQSIELTNRELLKSRIIEADVLIKPYLPDIDPARFDQVDECAQEGYDAAKAVIPEIQKIIEQKTVV